MKREAVLDTSGILASILVLRFLKYSSESIANEPKQKRKSGKIVFRGM